MDLRSYYSYLLPIVTEIGSNYYLLRMYAFVKRGNEESIHDSEI